jgi:hypothetical protein
MLLGRNQERLAIDRLLAEARQGHSGVLALVGEAGIGKTELLEYAAGRADEMRLLRARGVESEAEVAFAGLAELLRPALTVIDRIPAPQATALAGALTLGPSTAQDRFAIGAATLSLLSVWAQEEPLVLLIDDAHLLDGSSADALRFATRRLLADPIALIFAVREGEPSLLDGADLRILRVAGLDRSDAAELLERMEVPRDSVEHLYRATGPRACTKRTVSHTRADCLIFAAASRRMRCRTDRQNQPRSDLWRDLCGARRSRSPKTLPDGAYCEVTSEHWTPLKTA